MSEKEKRRGRCRPAAKAILKFRTLLVLTLSSRGIIALGVSRILHYRGNWTWTLNMGIILSRFRKKKTIIEVLEDLDTKIKDIEKYSQNTEQRHKKIVGSLILYSAILYIITAFIFYFYFFPASLYDQIFYIIPLLIFPILILLTKKMVTWYYKRKISHNQDKLVTMQAEKKKILDEVKETETYKKAKEILLKYAPDQLKMTPLSPQPTYKVSPASDTSRWTSTPHTITPPVPSSGELRRRTIQSQNSPVPIQSGTPQLTSGVPPGIAPTPTRINTPCQGIKPVAGYRTPLPRPILTRQRTYLDRFIDYLVGDGPSNRYALICRNCGSHNGMALKEEFEYFEYRCCYCYFWNPARKVKSSALKLESAASVSEDVTTNSDIETLKLTQVETPSHSDTDSDIEVVERPTESLEDNEHVAQPVEHEIHKPVSTPENVPEEAVEKIDADQSSS